MAKNLTKKLKDAIIDGVPDDTKDAIQELLNTDVSPNDIVKYMGEAMDVVGKKYENKEYFISDLIMAGEAMKAGLEVLQPLMKVEKAAFVGSVLIGVVEGDVHDIGKNIVTTMLRGAGFNVHDLGIDNTAEKFVEKAKEVKPDIVAASAYTSTSMPHLRNILTELRKSGVKDEVVYMIGGAPTTEDWAFSIGADGWAGDAFEAVKVASELIKKRRGS